MTEKGKGERNKELQKDTKQRKRREIYWFDKEKSKWQSVPL